MAPVIAEVLASLRATGAPVVRLCGSGATVFAAFSSAVEAEAAARAVRRAQPGWWVERTELA